MSIWSSIGTGPGVVAIENDDSAANYRAEGELSVQIDVATTRCHDHVRLTLWHKHTDLDVEVLLSPQNLRLLQDRIAKALELVS